MKQHISRDRDGWWRHLGSLGRGAGNAASTSACLTKIFPRCWQRWMEGLEATVGLALTQTQATHCCLLDLLSPGENYRGSQQWRGPMGALAAASSPGLARWRQALEKTKLPGFEEPETPVLVTPASALFRAAEPSARLGGGAVSKVLCHPRAGTVLTRQHSAQRCSRVGIAAPASCPSPERLLALGRGGSDQLRPSELGGVPSGQPVLSQWRSRGSALCPRVGMGYAVARLGPLPTGGAAGFVPRPA